MAIEEIYFNITEMEISYKDFEKMKEKSLNKEEKC